MKRFAENKLEKLSRAQLIEFLYRELETNRKLKELQDYDSELLKRFNMAVLKVLAHFDVYR